MVKQNDYNNYNDLGPDQTESHWTAFLVEEYNLKKQQLDTFFFLNCDFAVK